jgi:pyruvate formate lyase activating enzyme
MSDQAGLNLKTLLSRNTMESAPELVVALDSGAVRCVACGHRCRIPEGRAGVCRVRFNDGGRLRAPAGYVAGLQVDPIEKKPFYHVFPGREALSFGMLGCDFHCSYCQNWVTSQALRDDRAVSMPRFCDAASLADLATEHNVPVVVSTYNEPLITADWAMMVFGEVHRRGVRCGFVSNGNATREVLEFIRPCVELYKVDLKCFSDRNYRKLGGTLENVLDTIRLLKRMDFWVEVVTLVIPGFNDSTDELTQIADFIASVSVDIPWHVTAFHPNYKLTDPPATPTDTLLQACEIGRRAGLRFVYPGNRPGAFGDRENTYCPECRALLIRRVGFQVTENRMVGGKCPDCACRPAGVWESGDGRPVSGSGIPRRIEISPNRDGGAF